MALTREDWRGVRTILRSKLELKALRPGQKEALETVLQGQDALAVLPTGSGKSAIYQIAALMIHTRKRTRTHDPNCPRRDSRC